MSVTRAPTGQDLVCLVCHKQAQDIDHVVNRGMGGSKARDVPENKVPLCRECHTAKTNGVLETRLDEVTEGSGDWWYYWKRRGADLWIPVPVEVSQRYKCLVLSAAAEGGGGDMASVATVQPKTDSSAAAPSTGLTHDQRVAIAKDIHDAEQGRQWFAGDTANAWRAELGEEAEQYIDDFGYVQESIANIMRVCEAIPPAFRNAALRFSHHVVVADLNREDMEMWLDKCVEESWSVSEFRWQVKGGRPRVKRWSMEELREKGKEWEAQWEDGGGNTLDFLDWLGEG